MESMKLDDSCIVVFTSHTIEQMLAEGGSQAWKLGARASECQYLVCTWNSVGEYARANTGLRHREAFLVAPIAGIERALPPRNPKRSIIRFTEFARISIPEIWNRQQNPIHYSSLNEVLIDVGRLEFRPARPANIRPTQP